MKTLAQFLDEAAGVMRRKPVDVPAPGKTRRGRKVPTLNVPAAVETTRAKMMTKKEAGAARRTPTPKMTPKRKMQEEYRQLGSEPDRRWSAAELQRQIALRRLEQRRSSAMGAHIDAMYAKGRT